jgi:hypothetical protein
MSEKRLLTGARNGSIKAWNTANGQLINNFQPIDESEITGLIVNDKKRQIIAVGWSKKIITYCDSTFDDVKQKISYF